MKLRPTPPPFSPTPSCRNQRGHHASIEADRNDVVMQPETVAQFQAIFGCSSMAPCKWCTSREMPVLSAADITPTSLDQTQFDVIDEDGKVKIIAHKNDVKIHSHAAAYRDPRRMLAPMRSCMREKSNSGRALRARNADIAAVGATNGILNSDGPLQQESVAVVVITCLGLCHDDDHLALEALDRSFTRALYSALC